MALLYRTKNGALPHGKPRVFFTCHPQDWQAQFFPVCEELFQFCDCAVYCRDPEDPQPLGPEDALSLRQMQLVVIPVTAAFLTQPNPALDHDFRYAMEHHIPVLPLVREPGLDKHFAQKCGDLQYLDKTLRSPTAIPYEKKLEQFLRSVLLNDEQIRKIRAHFDGHVFLSYRKKDRRYIAELMKLIHSFPQFRDIGLWYDEYLTPGEDFNDEIETHLNDSRLFALIVTPNLVNEKNYVQEHEYPQAVKKHKPVLPIQYEPTDGNALRRDYPDIPSCLEPGDAAAVEAALHTSLGHIARRSNDTDPDHWYHIGLAYLTGTDVEVNHDLAVKLIIAAAEAGLEKAMEKLTMMYRNGDGVRRDPAQVIHWTQKLVELAQTRWENQDSDANALLCCYQLGIAASVCVSIDRYDLAAGYTKKKLALAKELYDAGVCDHTELLNTQELLAHIHSAQGYENEAFDRLYDAYLLLHGVCKKAGRVSAGQWIHLSRLCQNIGDLAQELHRLTDAEKFYRQAIKLLNALTKDETDLPRRTQLATLHQSLGNVCVLREDFQEAEQEYLAGLEIARNIAAELGDDRILISHYQSLGSLGDQRPGLGSGRNYLKKALGIAKTRDARKRTDETQTDLAECYALLGFSYYTNWALRLRNVIRGQAKPLLEQSLDLFRDLDRKQGTYTSRLRVHHTLLGLTELHVNMDFFREAEPYCREQLTISNELAKQSRDPESKIRLAYDLALMARIYKELKRTDEAISLAQKRVDLLISIARKVDTAEVWNDLAEADFDLALLAQSAHHMELAADIWHMLSQEYPDIPIYAQREQEAREYLP